MTVRVGAGCLVNPLTMSQSAKKISKSPPGMAPMMPAPATPASTVRLPTANAA